jgi:pimeloyl-ACP methyl ester carboxylesterase
MYNGYGVKKLILMAAAAPCFVQKPGCSYGITVDDFNEIIDMSYKDRPHMITGFLNKMFALPHSTEIIEWLKGICYEASCIGTVETAITLRDEDLSPDLRLIHVPTAIFHGKKDLICPYEYAELVNQLIEDSELITFEDCGHGVFYDNLDEFNKRFISFIHSN